MRKPSTPFSTRTNSPRAVSIGPEAFAAGAALLLLFALAVLVFFYGTPASAQAGADLKVGERLTYNISFNNYDAAGFAETRVVSRGKMEGRDAVELYGKLRSFELLSAAFYAWDDERTVYISEEDGMPLFVRETSNSGILPEKKTRNYLKGTPSELELLSMLFRIRLLAGAGNFLINEGGASRQFDVYVSGAETVSTTAGTFETQISEVQSPYLAELGITGLRINLTADSRRVPVLVKFETQKGDFEARLASIQDLTPDPTPTRTAVPTPTPVTTPTPQPTPRPYIENRPLSADLPFRLGEMLDYAVARAGTKLGTVRLRAAERKLVQARDGLLLRAEVRESVSGTQVFASSDSLEAWVDPETLAPYITSLKLGGAFSSFSGAILFNQQDGTATVGAGQPVQIPVGTHSVVSLAYAIRAFSLRGSPDPENPENDTRVSLFVGSGPRVVTLRPTGREDIEAAGRKWRSQVISVRTGEPGVDSLNIRIWLSEDAGRVPLRLVVGEYRADLLSVRNEPVR